MGTTYHNKPIVTDGLIFYVDAANKESYPGSGTTATDLAGPAEGTLVSGGFNSINLGAFQFDGIDDQLNFGNAVSTNIADGEDLTIDAWIRYTSDTGGDSLYPMIFTRRRSVQNQSSLTNYYLYLLNSTTSGERSIKFFTSYTNGNITSDQAVKINTWTHISVTCQSGLNNGTFIYKDTEQVANFRADTAGASNCTTIIGDSPYSSNNFPGQIASVKLYNRALSASEVTQNYNALKNRFI